MGKRIAIIGAGWMGIGCLRILAEQGHTVDVYEKEDDIGGVWHPNNWYVNLALHGTALTVEYYDFPLPPTTDKTSSMTAAQIHEYLNSYCKYKDLNKYIHLNSEILRIHYDSHKNICSLVLLKTDGSSKEIEYDYVVYTHGFTDRSVPIIQGQDRFLGKRYHSFDINEKRFKSIIHQNQKVAIIGASKTATDFVASFSKENHKLVWIYRKNYWFFRETIYRKALKNILNGKKINVYLYLYWFADQLNNLIRSKNPKLFFSILKILNLIHTYGASHTDYRKYHGGRIEDPQMELLKKYNREYHINGEIDSFDEHGILLTNGKKIDTDCVIFCTGSAGCHSLIPILVDNSKFSLSEIRRLYRSRVIPEVPAIIFTAFSDFNIGTVNGLIYGKWIDRYISKQPSIEYLMKHATSFSKPFFSSMNLFDSDEYFYARQKYMLKDFFESGELSVREVKKWAWSYHFSGKALEPYNFKEFLPPNQASKQRR